MLPPGQRPVAEPLVVVRWRFATATFDPRSLHLTVGGQEVDLDRRPLEMLALLLSRAGEVVTKDEILDAVWPDREVTEASLTKAMARLRHALGDTEHTIVRTVHGYGYQLAAAVHGAVEPVSSEATPLGFTAGDMVAGRPNWRLVRRLGSGGYGDAWLVEQTKSGALRVFKFATDGVGLAALRREVTVGRLLRQGLGPRADLVRILDWRLDEPPAFVEIDFFALGNLAEWASSQGGAAAVPLELRLELAAQIAGALAAIHGMAVLHKDLKPANVLMRVDEAGQPVIALSDFGSSRAMDLSKLDALGITRMDADEAAEDSTASTLMYRAPELSAGGVPTMLADVYALGVVLYQLASGDLQRPLGPGWEVDIDDPLLRQDIGLAAAGDPAKRLADAAELARRLRSLPARRAARASAEAAAADIIQTRRALELARARRTPLLALLGVLVLGLMGSLALYLRSEREAARAVAVTQFLTEDLLSAANPALAADPNVPIGRVLAVAAADLDRRFPAGALDRAEIEAAIGGAYAGLADASRARPLLQSALETLRTRLGEDAPQTQAVRLAMAALAERIVDSDGMRAAGQAILDSHPSDPAATLSGRYYKLAGDYIQAGDDAACVAGARALLADSRRLLGEADPVTLRVQSELASCLASSQQAGEAVHLARDAVALTQRAYGPDHLLVQERRYMLAMVLVQTSRTAEAIDVLQDVRRRLLLLSGTESEMSARAANQLGMAYAAEKRYAEAEPLYRQVLAFSERTSGAGAELSRAALNNLAAVLALSGRPNEAVPLARRVFDTARKRYGADSPNTLWAENNLADDLSRAGELPEAETLFTDAVTRGQRVFTHGEYDLGMFSLHLGEVLAKQNRSAEAHTALTQSVRILQATLGDADARTVRAKDDLARK
jgi:eukaryotic-like serine/threonine-protein kinase